MEHTRESGADTLAEIKQAIKVMLVRELMLQVAAEEIGDEQELFGPGGLGLDSVDALQLVVALDKQFGVKIPDPETARAVLKNVDTLAQAVVAQTGAGNEAAGGGAPAKT